MNKNCWDHHRCGFGPHECNGSEGRVCPAAVHEHADGFLGGENGGRACYFILGTVCCGEGAKPQKEKQKRCKSCSFYHILNAKYGKTFSEHNFLRYVVNSENRSVY
ncbi:MAG: hypothetical protein HQL68_00770 [Magnetococcales bacterium]|nr:hypothetical protein [Magnetococcales bacterium]